MNQDVQFDTVQWLKVKMAAIISLVCYDIGELINETWLNVTRYTLTYNLTGICGRTGLQQKSNKDKISTICY